MRNESGLQRRQQGVVGRLDRGDRIARMHHRECEAGINPRTVHQHRAGAALAMVAAFLGAGQAQMFTQRIQQRGPCVHPKRMVLAVDGQRKSGGLILSHCIVLPCPFQGAPP